MQRLGLVAVLCALASFAAAPASAFDIQGKNASLQDGSPAGAQPFTSPADQYLSPQYDFTKGSSLALPYISKDDTSSSFVSDYGNMIAIPGPGVDKPAPAWAYR
ncbi:MAG TPA: hypothetical protein VNJ31_06330 [Methyloceanibacter sp.]|nr:hypothetical protein [Methyloceanibacter sp.]